MKKYLLFCLLIVFCLSLCACGGADKASSEKSPSQTSYSIASQGAGTSSSTSVSTEVSEPETEPEPDIPEYFLKLLGTYELPEMYIDTLDSAPDTVVLYEDLSVKYGEDNYTITDFSKPDKGSKSDRVTLHITGNSGDYITLSFSLYPDGYVQLNSYYLRKDLLADSLAETYSQFIGDYRHISADMVPFSITSDFKFIAEGNEYPIVYKYSPAAENPDERFSFYVKGYGDDTDYYSLGTGNFYFNGLFCVNNYVRLDQLDFVTVTPENFSDYFEFSDYVFGHITRNAFNELISGSITRYYMLKGDYSERYIPELSEVAVEYVHNVHLSSVVNGTVDLETGIAQMNFKDDDSPTAYVMARDVVVSRLSQNFDGSIHDRKYYLCSDGYTYISSQIKQDGTRLSVAYTITHSDLDSLKIIRSNTTLCFIKPEYVKSAN